MTCVVLGCVFLTCIFNIPSQASSQTGTFDEISIPNQKATLGNLTMLNDNLFPNVNHDCADCTDKTACQSPESPHWLFLTNLALEVFRVQNNLTNHTDNFPTSAVVLILQDMFLWKPVLTFINKISLLLPGITFLQFHLDDGSALRIFKHTIEDLMERDVYINSVFIFSNNMFYISKLVQTISASQILIWTSVIHVTEWIIASSCSDIVDQCQTTDKGIDFMTLIYSSFDNMTIVAQKSRTAREFVTKVQIGNQIKAGSQECTKTTRRARLTDEKSVCTKGRGRIRAHPLIYLKSQKSVMAGLRLSAALPENAYRRTVFKKRVGNETVMDGFSVAVMNLIARILGFQLDYTYVSDGGDYGEVLANGTITGLTGKLARREAAMAALVSRVDGRETVIDFLPTPLIIESANIVYRLPKRTDTVDTTYIKIFKPEFLLSLVGPLIVIALTAIVVHVVTLSCTTAEPQRVSWQYVQNLDDCTENICFHHKKDYQGQTARILRASWSVFCLITVSAYSAYLVTTFAVVPNQLKIRTFKELLDHTEFSFGMHGSSKALPIIMKSSADPYLHGTWIKLLELNKTNPSTFSLDLGYHVKRLMEGHYAFLDNFSIGSGEFYDYVPDNQTDIIAYPQTSIQGFTSSFIAIPKHVFFKDALYDVHLNLELSGVVLILEEIYFSRRSQPPVGKAQSEIIVVHVDRIELIIYISLGGIGFSGLCLAAECFIGWWTRRSHEHQA